MQKAISSKQQDGTLHVNLITYWQQAAKPGFIMLWTHLKEWVCYPTHTLLWPCSSMPTLSSSDSSVMLSGATCCRFRCRFFMSLSLILVFWCSKSETENLSCESYKPLISTQNIACSQRQMNTCHTSFSYILWAYNQQIKQQNIWSVHMTSIRKENGSREREREQSR